MKVKIDWYKEVLELEPGSKVFFPLAQLFAEYGQVQNALSTLRHGLERHPEFIEARLYLIELLYKNGQIVHCEPLVDQLTSLFSKYSGFWEAWSACAAATGKKQNLSLTLRFLSVLFQRPDIGMGEVLEKGLHAFAAAQKKLPSAPEHAIETSQKNLPTEIPVNTRAPVAATGAAAGNFLSPEIQRAEKMYGTDEPYTLRTRSMADLLAGQDDIDGALEIYRELALRAESPEERHEINERIAQLSAPQSQFDAAPSPRPPEAVSRHGKQRMQHLLESLAERLEARAQG